MNISFSSIQNRRPLPHPVSGRAAHRATARSGLGDDVPKRRCRYALSAPVLPGTGSRPREVYRGPCAPGARFCSTALVPSFRACSLELKSRSERCASLPFFRSVHWKVPDFLAGSISRVKGWKGLVSVMAQFMS